jgi:hypothetical protein
MAALVVLGTMNWQPFRKPQNLGLTIEAVMVDTSKIREQREEARRAVERENLRQQRAEQLAEQRKREQEQKQKREREAEKQRQLELEAQRKREAQDKLQKLQKERERKLEEERQQQQRELEALRQQREEAERQRKLEAERLKQLEARRQEEANEQRRRLEEAALQKQLEAEEREFRAGQLATLSDSYQAAIQSFVTQNWLRDCPGWIEVQVEDRADSRRRGDLGSDIRLLQRRRSNAAFDCRSSGTGWLIALSWL